MASELIEHCVLMPDEGVVDAEALQVVAAGLPVVEAALGDAGQELLDIDIEVDGGVGHEGKGVDVFEPLAGGAADGAAGDEGEDVAVDEGDHAGAQGGQDDALEAVPEVGGVEEVEGDGVEHVAALGALDPGADERRAGQAAVDDGEA